VTRYLLDTCTISDFFLDRGQTRQLLQAISPDQVAISTITTMEVHYGFALKPSAKRKFGAVFQSFFQIAELVGFDDAMAQVAASIRAHLKTTGQPIGSWDLLIGATALTRGYVLVTSNVREFERIEGLKVENWR
jgi:tRNA(fMet)-specific endonuclease VapC